MTGPDRKLPTPRVGAARSALGPALLAALAPAACLDEIEDPGAPAEMCQTSEDCDAEAGEICDEGVCWGGPPDDRRFAAVLSPPEDRDDLAPTEIPELEVEDDGHLSAVEFEAARAIAGRVVLACDDIDRDAAVCEDDLSIPARVDLERPSRLPGRRPLSRTFTAAGGAGEGEAAFEEVLPPRAEGDPPYRVKVRPITPEARTLDERDWEDTAPPVRTTLDPAEAADGAIVWELGRADEHVRAAGRVVDAAGQGVGGQRVYAEGRFPGQSERERVSTRVTTGSDGAFELRVPIGLDGPIDLIASPPPGESAPELARRGVNLDDLADEDDSIGDLDDVSELVEPIAVPDLVVPSHPSPRRFALPIEGKDPGGGSAPVADAEVSLRAELASQDGIDARVVATATTDEDGIAELSLIPAGEENRAYEVAVTPAAGDIHAAVRDVEIQVGPGSDDATNVLPPLALDQRTLLDGIVVAADGAPVAGARVDARPATELLWSLGEAERERVEGYGVESTTADDAGRFELWLDPMLGSRAGVYDLEIVPPARALSARWLADGIALDPERSAIDLDAIELPPVANARGVVTAEGEPVPGAEIRLYEIGAKESLCAAEYAPGGDACEPPARLRGLERAGDDGRVWLHLPNRP